MIDLLLNFICIMYVQVMFHKINKWICMSRLCCHTIDYERGTWMVLLSYNLSISVRAMTWGFQLPIQVLIKKKEKEQTFATCGYYSFPDPSQFENSLIKLVYLSKVTTIIRKKKNPIYNWYIINNVSTIYCSNPLSIRVAA